MSTANDLIQLPPQEFIRFLRESGISRFYFVYDRKAKRVLPSHASLQPIADFIQGDRRDFMQHEGIFFQVTPKYDVLQAAFVHMTVRGAGAGGVRYWKYDTVEDYLRDGLRLSKGMTRKNALAGLWWGGGKGVMAENPAIAKSDAGIRQFIYHAYGGLVTSIRGCYVTAEDVGTNVSDMANIFDTTRFTTCIPPELGGSGNPSVPTARGVICGMEGALDFLSGNTLAGKTVAVQGTGNVGVPLIKFLFEKGVSKIVACDVNPENVQRAKTANPGKNLEVEIVDLGDQTIIAAACDILAPCATGAILNPETIPDINAKIVCGAANNQLGDAQRDDALLHERGVVYVPDFLTNRMGIVNCANEQYGYISDDPAIEKHFSRDWEHSVFQTTQRVLRQSRQTGAPPAKVAMRLADELSLQPHPILGHRGQQIIDSLVANQWHEC